MVRLAALFSESHNFYVFLNFSNINDNVVNCMFKSEKLNNKNINHK